MKALRKVRDHQLGLGSPTNCGCRIGDQTALNLNLNDYVEVPRSLVLYDVGGGGGGGGVR